MDVIQAKNEYALRSSMDQLRGSVQKAIRDIREKLIYHIAYIESALDDPEHISLDGYPQELLEVVDNEQKEVKRLLKTSSDGKMIQEGIQTVILWKTKCRKILTVKSSDRRKPGYCDRYCRNDQRHSGGIYHTSWNISEDY